jgi:hypothetical protein
MASESVSVSGPVRVHSDSKERVAFDLAQLIASHTRMEFDQKNETYWLNLYAKCLRVTKGGLPA